MTGLEPAQLVGLGGTIGALLRYAVTARVRVEAFPVGTLIVNVLGSFVLALVTFLGAGSEVLLLVGTGACGAFTTFSSFAFETVRLWESDRPVAAALNAVGNLLGAGLAVGLAWVTTHFLL